MLRHLRDGDRVLDIGASDRALERRLKKHFPKLLYKSMDVDRDQFHDYYDLEEIQETFDAVFLFEVIEHLPLEEGIKMLGKIYELLKEGGRLILTTPNTFNPGRYWRDATHKQPYCYDELGGILMSRGFEIKEMYRTYSDAFHRYLFRKYVMAPLHRYLGVDFAKSILIVAVKGLREKG
ncbi:MAG: class I SAM-dependent methyltransferase [Desulfobacterota bacterium]|nr:class I SAM-dependent methyltransferase [Thermodesulfobacteriota bacterium]